MPLNIDWQQILLHLFNFVVLFAILYFLLYKPVKRFMDKRTEDYKNMEDEAKANLADSEKTKEEYLEKLASVDDEIAEKRKKTMMELEAASAAKLRRAEEESAKIIADARISIENDRAKMLKEAQNEISDMITSAAEKLIVNASTSQVYDRFLDEAKRGEADE